MTGDTFCLLRLLLRERLSLKSTFFLAQGMVAQNNRFYCFREIFLKVLVLKIRFSNHLISGSLLLGVRDGVEPDDTFWNDCAYVIYVRITKLNYCTGQLQHITVLITWKL